MNDDRLGREARELIEQALREEEQVAPVELARIRRRVLSVGVGVGALGSAGKTLAVPGTAAVSAISVVKATLLGASAAVVALGLSSVVTPKPVPNAARGQPAILAPAPSLLPRDPIQVSPENARVLEPLAAEKATRPAVAPRSPPPSRMGTESERPPAAVPTPPAAQQGAASAANPSNSALLAEVALLERVQTALRSGAGAEALALLDQKLPRSGQLGAERLAAEVFAACQAGDRGRARRAAQLFFQNYPGTPATARVRASCAGEESGNGP